MFCPKCGANNESGANFCAVCGTKMVDNQPGSENIAMDLLEKATQIPEKLQTLPELAKQASSSKGNQALTNLKALPKAVKILSVAALASIVVLCILITVVTAVFSPQKTVKGYFEAKANGDYPKMFGYLSLNSSEFITYDNFLKYMESGKKLDIVNFEVNEASPKSSSDSGFMKIYTIEYLPKGSSITQKETVTIVKQIGKKFLFFDDYKVNADNMTISDYQFHVPIDCDVYIDDIKLSQKSSGQNASYLDVYVIPEIFYGNHDIKVEHPECEPYTDKISIDEYSGNEYYIRDLTLKGTVSSDIAKKSEETYKRIVSSAISGDSFDKLNLSQNDSEMKNSYDNLTAVLKNKDGVGYKSITIKKFTDKSNGKINDSMKYSCIADVEYEYVEAIKKGKNIGEIKDSSSTSILFTYVYEGNAWTLLSLDNLGAFGGAETVESDNISFEPDAESINLYPEIDLAVAKAIYDHYKSYISAINSTDINMVNGATASYAEYLRKFGISGENLDYYFDFYEMRINMDTIAYDSFSNEVSLDVNCLFKYSRRESNEAWANGANLLLCRLIYDEQSEKWLVDDTYEQKSREDKILGIDTSDKNLLVINDGSYYEIFKEQSNNVASAFMPHPAPESNTVITTDSASASKNTPKESALSASDSKSAKKESASKEENLKVPKVSSQTEANAKKELEKAGFSVTAIEETTDRPNSHGMVLRCDESGKTLPKGSNVTIYIGYCPWNVIPNVTGKTRLAAERLLQQAGFIPVIQIEDTYDKKEDGKVLECEEEGCEQGRGERVTIIIGRYVDDY